MSLKPIKTALVSVYHKEGLDNIITLLKKHQVKCISTGGTKDYLEQHGLSVMSVEELTNYPSILGGRVKTLHPKIFGGILNRREDTTDQEEVENYNIPSVDLVIVDLYPFEETVKLTSDEQEIIEKIDIGGISLIRAAAKNYTDVLVIASRSQYESLEKILVENGAQTSVEQRKAFAREAFNISSHYDTMIYRYFSSDLESTSFKASYLTGNTLRYGENPHQKGIFYGELDSLLEQIHGKELSYNNLVDIESAVRLIEEFQNETVFAILKHTNACGAAIGSSVAKAYDRAFQADTVSAFGGVLATNSEVDAEAAKRMNTLFFEVLISPGFHPEALDILMQKKNRILLVKKGRLQRNRRFKSLLNGIIAQDDDLHTDTRADLQYVTENRPSEQEIEDLLFASKVCKHTKSNTIVLAKNGQMLASGVGQTSRVDALEQAIKKAGKFGFNLENSVMASDAFFPFPDCVEIGHKVGVSAIIQPGGSIKDQDSIDYCNKHQLSMVFTGYRHFLH